MGFKTVSTRGNFSRREINIVWLYCGLATLLFVNQFGETSRTSQYGYLKASHDSSDFNFCFAWVASGVCAYFSTTS